MYSVSPHLREDSSNVGYTYDAYGDSSNVGYTYDKYGPWRQLLWEPPLFGLIPFWLCLPVSFFIKQHYVFPFLKQHYRTSYAIRKNKQARQLKDMLSDPFLRKGIEQELIQFHKGDSVLVAQDMKALEAKSQRELSQEEVEPKGEDLVEAARTLLNLSIAVSVLCLVAGQLFPHHTVTVKPGDISYQAGGGIPFLSAVFGILHISHSYHVLRKARIGRVHVDRDPAPNDLELGEAPESSTTTSQNDLTEPLLTSVA